MIFGSLAVSLALGGALLVEFRSGPIVAGLVALSLYGFLTVGLPRFFQDKAGADLPSPPILDLKDDDPRHALLVEAHEHIMVLRAAIPIVPLNVGHVLDALARHALTILDTVASHPEKLTPILRFFTYYLPATADLVSDRLKLEAMPAKPACRKSTIRWAAYRRLSPALNARWWSPIWPQSIWIWNSWTAP
jgi:hypothetical protein